jgi:hypothetical protein
MWKANGKTTTLKTFLDSLSPKLAMDLSRDRQIEEEEIYIVLYVCSARRT